MVSEDPSKRELDLDNSPADADAKRTKHDAEPPAPDARKGMAKDKKVWESRRRRGTRQERPEGELGASLTEDKDKAPRLPKRQCALLIGFCGSGFNGMQIQPDVRTIEGELFSALVAAGAVSKDNADDPVKVNLQRAARTDAGVHAAGNVVSLKLITTVPGVPDLIAHINDALPPEIRLWGFQRVQNSFNARLRVYRKYTYYFPSYMLIPPKPGSGIDRAFREQSAAQGAASNLRVPSAASDAPDAAPSSEHAPAPDSSPAPDAPHTFWSEPNVSASPEAEMARKRRWRVGPTQMASLRAAAARFAGTHNFHNFTVGRDPKDRSCLRHMKTIEVGDPVVHGETEWISVMLHGQSFMLHQRKMMTVLVIAVRTGTPAHVIDALYKPDPITIPKMPSLGLLLEHPIFESYSRKAAALNVQQHLTPGDADFRAPLDFEEYRKEMEAFKEREIYRRMREAEERLCVFAHWLAVLDRYAGSDLRYFNALGTVPACAIVQRNGGARRSNPFRERKRFDATDFGEGAAGEAAFAAAAAGGGEGEELEGSEKDGEVEGGEGKMGKRELEEAEG